MEYGVRYTQAPSVVVSPVSNDHLAKAIASSWRRSLYPDAVAVCRVSPDLEWQVMKDSFVDTSDLEYKEG